MKKRLYLMLLAAFVATTAFCTDARQQACQMYPGWNLGNTMESSGGETGWQDTRTTKHIIDFVKAQGFRSVRIPCAWNVHCNQQGRIDPSWMARVKKIVKWCLDDSLYVVLNDHWDNGWIEVEGFSSSTSEFQPVSEETINNKILRLADLWTQIATEFRDFDNRLLFAGLNEPFQQYNLFNGRHKELTPILMRYNQAFVNTVRATGGRNAQRTLVVQTPSTSAASATDPEIAFDVPTDIAGPGHLMVEVHFYEPWNFCGQESGGAWFWGKPNLVEGDEHTSTWGDEAHMERMLQALDDKFVSRGYPVIIGECGANWRQVPHHQAQHDASIRYWYSELNRRAVNHGCVTMLWDINVADRKGEQGTFTVIDRAQLKVFNPIALEAILAGSAAGHWPQSPTDDSSQFVTITDVVPDVILEIRYFGTYNFVGTRIDGYEVPTALLTKQAADSLKAVSDDVMKQGYRLKIYDAYRPQKGVDHFVRWAKDVNDTKMKSYFYPDLDKSVLFPQEYICLKSGHTRGSTLDLTLFDMNTEKELDMGGTFDWFGPESHPDFCGNPETGEYTGDNSKSPANPKRSITPEQFKNRMILRQAMLRHGFKPFDTEWWHFTLKDEPFPDTYFTFPVK